MGINVVLLAGFLLRLASIQSAVGLSDTFYQQTCPNVASIVTRTMKSQASLTNIVPPATLRLFFHDCMVQGCDASIMISSTSDNHAERDASDNLTLAPQAFDAIIAAKQAVEEQCPGIVSCADIIALAARDVVVFAGGKTWDVPLGRRDGLVSQASQVSGRLPQASFNVGQLAKNFAAAGLSLADMVVLSGGHTIGVSHCNQFSNRLYAFSSSHKTDPSMDPTYAQFLEQTCPRTGGDPFATSFLDPTTFDKFDNVYYQNLQKGKGLLFSDEVLFTDESTRDLVNELAASESLFFSRFKDSMIKLSKVGVKEGKEGEIRRDCTTFN